GLCLPRGARRYPRGCCPWSALTAVLTTTTSPTPSFPGRRRPRFPTSVPVQRGHRARLANGRGRGGGGGGGGARHRRGQPCRTFIRTGTSRRGASQDKLRIRVRHLLLGHRRQRLELPEPHV